MDSKKYNLKLDSEEEVRRLLTALPRVDAPSNFDFEVKARIASRKHQGSWVDRIPFALRFAFPTLLIMLVGAYVYLYQYAGQAGPALQSEVTVPVAPETRTETVAPSTPAETPGQLVAQNDSASAAASTQGSTNDRVNNPANKQNLKAPQGGSKTLASGNGLVITRPGAEDPRKPVAVGPDGSQLSVKQVLSPIGIQDTVFENGGWKVLVVTEDSPAMRSGIIKGDIVTAIGNQTLNQNSSFRGTASTNKITVVRDGKPVSIKVQQN